AFEVRAHVILVRRSPTWNVRWGHSGEVNRQADKLVAEQCSANDARIPVVVVANGDGGSGTEVVIHIVFHQTHGTGVCVPLEVPANPVVTIAKSVWKQAAS